MSVLDQTDLATPRSWAPSDVRTLVTQLVGTVPRGWARLLGSALLAICATGASVALMGTSAWLLSRAAERPDVMALLVAATAVRVFGITRGGFRYAERLASHDVALRMQSALRLATYDKLSRTTLLGTRRGDLLLRVTADVESIMDVIVRVALPFCSAAVVVVGTSAILGAFSPSAAAVLFVCCVVAGVLLPWLTQRWSLRTDALAAPVEGRLADQVQQMATAGVDLVAYDAQDAALDEFSRLDAVLRDSERRAAWTRGLATGLQHVAMGVAVAAALVLGAQAVVRGQMLGRDLAVLCLTPLALQESFGDLTKAAQTLTHARTGLARVVELLVSRPVGVGDRPVADVAADDAPSDVLVLRDLTIGWPDNPPVLSGLDLELAAGQTVAVTGASGVGKTTLAATVMGLIPPVAGTVDATRRIGYLAQDAHIFATTVAENVRIGNPFADDEAVEAALVRAGAGHLRLDRLVGEDGSALSGGEARRLALARVLVSQRRPSLVILDEPTEHLDHETASGLLDDLWAALGDTALLAITHDPDVVRRCQREMHLA